MNTATYNKDFHRTVKKAEIPTCNILGVDIAAIDGKTNNASWKNSW